jgi:hypothetical protein
LHDRLLLEENGLSDLQKSLIAEKLGQVGGWGIVYD